MIKWSSKGAVKPHPCCSTSEVASLKELIYRIKPSCTKCPYTLGLVHTLVNPCPQCKSEGYRAYKRFKQSANKNQSASNNP